MAHERMPLRGFPGLLTRWKKLLSTELWNGLTAKLLRGEYSLDAKDRFSGQPNSRFEVAIVAICKGEDEYLKEWLEFHLLVGVGHFFIYDNGDNRQTEGIVRPYVDSGLVTYVPFPDLPDRRLRRSYGKRQFRKLSMQNLAYGDCSRKYASRCRWLAKIDLDEFLYPLSPYNTLAEAFAGMDKLDVKGFTVAAARFGPSGRRERSGLPVIESYSLRYPKLDRNWKAVGRGDAVSGLLGYHGCHTYFYKLDPRAHALDDEAILSRARINHYVVKSRAEYMDKIAAHAVGHKAGKESPAKWDKVEAEANCPDDGAILRFLPELKKRLADRAP